ncbi:MAG: helix-turn-helix domain-containing protein [Clostridia bacterium]|nr:helix-turn-helix domain-containing protein [Clostridia bacterium]
MDNKLIGTFITECRKSQNLTQLQLAEKLFVSEKTISKWETGKGLPDTSLMLPLCEILNISVKELLSGKRLEEKEYKQTAEENLANLVNEHKENKKKMILSIITGVVSIAILLLSACLSTYLPNISEGTRIVIIVIGLVIALCNLVVTTILDLDSSIYECPDCKHHFKPTFSAYMNGVHTITRRRLKCPNCGKKHYCKRKLSKEIKNDTTQQ